MKLSEIRDDFQRRYLRECYKRNLKPMDMPEASLAMDLSEIQQDIQRRLSVVQSYTTITTEEGVNTYNLPTNFGKHKMVMIGGLKLTETSTDELLEHVSANSTPNYFAIYPSGKTQKIILDPTPNGAYTVYIYYFLDLGYFSPSGSATQDWGQFDQNYFYNYSPLPERYYRAIVLGMLSNWFLEFKVDYERELLSLKESRVSSLPQRTYSMGGYKSKGTTMSVIVESTTSSTPTTTTNILLPTKALIVTYTYSTNAITITDQEGYEGSVTGSYVGGNVVITNDNPEFSVNNLYIEPNNTSVLYSNTSSTVTLTPPSTTNFSCKIYQFD